MDPSNFNHKITIRVRFNEVDMLGVCNNAVYINYFEQARLDYFKNIGLIPRDGLFSDGKLFFVVRNEINYLNPAKFDDELAILSKISFIKNSSFGFEHIIINNISQLEIANGNGVIVQVDPKTGKSMELSKEFYEKVKNFDYGVKILKQ
jgi:acyl-CoA thioester hydrolase